jgi:NADH-quinone oxidoreductase subunit J
MIEVLFFIAGAVTLLSAALTVSSTNAVHALLYLVVTMLAIALIFFLLGSSFAAALQIIVYAGAVMVLFVFVTMMLHQGEKSLQSERQLYHLPSSFGPFMLCGVLLAELIYILNTFDHHNILNLTSHGDFKVVPISVKTLGTALYGPYQLLVVIAALMLLSALISAIHIARRQGASR